MTNRNEVELFEVELFNVATQYYIIGRFALFAGFIPVCGNLFHHAIEMYLKGYFCESQNLEGLRKKYGHNLMKLWDDFKRRLADPSLDKFDSLILRLHKFERIRYPDEYLKKGMMAAVGIRTGDSSHTINQIRASDTNYGFDLEEVDRLVRIIFEKSNYNPAYFAPLKTDGSTYLLKENQDGSWWARR